MAGLPDSGFPSSLTVVAKYTQHLSLIDYLCVSDK